MCVIPVWAVTMVLMMVWPTAKVIAPDAAPEITGVPLTVTVAVGSCVTAVTVTDAVALLTNVT